MIRIGRETKVEVKKHGVRIARNGYICYQRDVMLAIHDDLLEQVTTLKRLAISVMMQNSATRCYVLNRESIHRYLVEYERCPERYFKVNGVKNFSLDSKKVLEKLVANGFAKEFLHYYMTYMSLSTKCSNVKNILGIHVGAGVNEFGHALHEIRYSVSLQTNLRFNYNSFDIIAQISKDFLHSISVEQGYFLGWGDFAQSDFRIAYNLFIRSEKNDEIMRECKDKYEGLARIVAMSAGEEFSLEKFKEIRGLYKTLTLATIYGKRTSKIAEESHFIENLTKFLMTCTKYVEYYNRLSSRFDLGLPMEIESYFGHVEVCPIYPHYKFGTITNALNCPIQTGTSEITIISANMILDAFYSRGCTEDDISLYLIRHDEPVFRISKSIIENVWLLKQFQQILVDNWMPLELNFEFGYNYGVVDEALTQEIHTVYKTNQEFIQTFIPSEIVDTDYYPIQAVATIKLHWIKVLENTIIVFYLDSDNEATYSLVETTDEEELQIFCMQKVREFTGCMKEKNYNGIVVLNNFFSAEDYENDTFIKYNQVINDSLTKASKLCRAMTCKYCDKNEIVRVVDEPDESDWEWIKQVEQLDV